MSKLSEANDELNKDKVAEAKEKISKSSDLVKQRQKLIRLVDSSQAGWRAVDEYVKNPIASFLEDETEIQEAQNRTEKWEWRKVETKEIIRAPLRKTQLVRFSRANHFLAADCMSSIYRPNWFF